MSRSDYYCIICLVSSNGCHFFLTVVDQIHEKRGKQKWTLVDRPSTNHNLWYNRLKNRWRYGQLREGRRAKVGVPFFRFSAERSDGIGTYIDPCHFCFSNFRYTYPEYPYELTRPEPKFVWGDLTSDANHQETQNFSPSPSVYAYITITLEFCIIG